MKISWLNKSLLLLVVWNLELCVATQKECSLSCADYHRLCPGLNDPNFYAEYKKEIAESGDEVYFAHKDLPAPDCKHVFYQYGCPKSCGKCTLCTEDEIDELRETLKELQENSATPKPAPKPLQKLKIHSAHGDPATHVHDMSVLANSWDGNNSTHFTECYVTDKEAGAYSAYDFEYSTVKAIRMLNRDECCYDWIGQVDVNVCTSGVGCTFCGQTKAAGPSDWTYLECAGDGVVGSTVLVRSTFSHLSFCEIEIFGEPVTPLKSIEIKGASGDIAFTGHPVTVIEKSWDRLNSTTYSDCYISNMQAGAYATYDIEFSRVRAIQILNRDDCCEWSEGILVDVCIDDTGCERCGVTPHVGKGQWTYLECAGNNGVLGNKIKFVTTVSHLQICELYVVGQIEPPHKVLPILSGQGVRAWHGHPETTIGQSYDLSYNTNYAHCYVTETQAGTEADYFIKRSTVKGLRILNRDDPTCCTEWTGGVVVDVCDGDDKDSCERCGITVQAPRGLWNTLICDDDEGIVGNRVHLVTTVSHLIACELQILGV